jgi:trehalose-phosphatase
VPVKPSALNQIDRILQKSAGKEPLFFLDYDGTLTPIASHPREALLPKEMQAVLDRLGDRYFVAIVTGRGLKDIQTLIPLKHVYFAASHGFILKDPEGQQFTCAGSDKYLDEIQEAYRYLYAKLGGIPGVHIENKEFSIAVHDRLVNAEVEHVRKVVAQAPQQFKGLKVTYGKRVSELRPNVEWDKGKAVLWLIENALNLEKPPFPIVIGDDLTDEDAFEAVKGSGVSICVQEAPRETHADYILKDTLEVQKFLEKMEEQ